MIQNNDKLFSILRLIDDENPEITNSVNQELKKNSLELILHKEDYKNKLMAEQQYKFDILLKNIHLELVTEALNSLLDNTLEDIDLEEGMTILSYWDNSNVDCQDLKNQIAFISNSIQMPKTGHPLAFIDHISNHLINQFKISKNNEDVSNPENYYLYNLFETRKGIPFTMSILYILIGNHLGFPVYGVPIPGNFILKFFNEEDEIFFDPFFKEKKYSKQMCYDYLKEIDEIDQAELILRGCSNIEILLNVLSNLYNTYSLYQNAQSKIHQIEFFQKMLQTSYAIPT
jgi:regulator of sirC expression with transglutaminase-like and TPR domain